MAGCDCKDSLAVLIQKEYNAISKQINDGVFSSSPSISCNVLFKNALLIKNLNESDLVKLELLMPTYQNSGVIFNISLSGVVVQLYELNPVLDVKIAGLLQIMDNYIKYNEALHESSVGKFRPFEYDVNHPKFNQSVPEITDTLSEVDVHCKTTYGYAKNYDFALVFSNGARE